MTATRRFIMQKARRHTISVLRPLVGAWFQGLFHSPNRSAFHLSLTVLTSLSVSREYLALPDGPGRFTQNYSCSALLRMTLRLVMLRIRDCHPLRSFFPERSPHNQSTTTWSYNPHGALLRRGFGLFPVRSPLLGESLSYFLFLQVLRCFSSLR